MNILVTGGAGFIGSHLVEWLEKQGHAVTCFDRNPLGHWAGKNRVCADVRESFVDETPDFIYHLASTVGVRNVLQDPSSCIRNITESTAAVLDDYDGVPGMYFSTSEVYGMRTGPLHEDDEFVFSGRARWSYAAAKLCGEWMARQAGWKVVRLFNVVGPRQNLDYGAVFPKFIQSAISGTLIPVYGSGEQVRTFTSVRDVVQILDVLRDRNFDVVNVGSENYLSINSLASIVKRVLQSDARIERIPYQLAYDGEFEECPERIPSLQKLYSLIGKFKFRSLQESIMEVSDHVRQSQAQAATL